MPAMDARDARPRRMNDASAAPRRAPSVLILAALCIAAALGNIFRLPFFFGLDFLFGGIAVFLALEVFGLRAGMLAALVSGAVTITIWNHPYAGIVFVLEALVVGLLRRRAISLVVADTLFWVPLGSVLIWFAYRNFLNVEATATQLVVLKDAVNGIFNALVATLILQYSPLGRVPARGQVRFRETVFNLLVAFVLLPSLLLLVLSAARDMRAVEERIRDRLDAERAHLVTSVQDWADRREYAVARAGEAVLTRGPQSEQQSLQQLMMVVDAIPDIRGLLVTGSDGTPIHTAPPISDAAAEALAGAASVRTVMRRGQPVVSDLFTDENGIPIVTIAVPVLRGGDLIGVSVAIIHLERLRSVIFADIGPDLEGTLSDSAGRVIATTRSAEATPNAPVDPSLRVDRGNGLVQVLPPGVMPPINRWRGSVYQIDEPIRDGVPWMVSVRGAVAPYQRSVQQDQTSAFVILILLGLLAFPLAALASRAVTGPVTSLASVTRDLPARVVSGTPVKWPQARAAELSALIANFREVSESLAASFREMQSLTGALSARTEQLAAANEEVRALNTGLEQRVRERTRELEERNAEQETFIYTVSHDLRTPLLSISGMADLLKEAIEGGDEEEVRFLLGRVQGNVHKMGDLLNDLLSLSRAGRQLEEKETVNLGATVAESLAELDRHVRQRGVKVELPPEWPRINYPPREAHEVASNLLHNALKWAGGDGVQPHIRVTWQEAGGRAVLTVEDNGPGVPEEYRDRVFELFRKLDPETPGTGVGLAIAKRVVERHGGRIWVDDSPLGGAAFHAELPLAPSHGSDGTPA
jgi:signal transduction histidine kinase